MHTKLLAFFALVMLSACCTIGPDDHPGGVVQYLEDCKEFMTRR